jgi:hypothetical protein
MAGFEMMSMAKRRLRQERSETDLTNRSLHSRRLKYFFKYLGGHLRHLIVAQDRYVLKYSLHSYILAPMFNKAKAS